MNANQLINMITRMFVRKAMNYGMKAGIDAISRQDSTGRAQPQKDRKSAPASPKIDRRQARQAMRMARKIGRF